MVKQTKPRRRASPGLIVVMAVVIGLVVIVLVLVVTAAVALSRRRDDLWLEVAKVGLQFVLITVLGSLVGYTLRYSETERADRRRTLEREADERRRLDDARLRVFREVVDAYNQVKAVRRVLRSLGVLTVKGPLSAAQAEGIRSQMLALNRAQLTLEAVKREVKESQLFRDPPTLAKYLEMAEVFLGDVLKKWERHGGEIWAGATPEAVSSLDIASFVGETNQYPQFKSQVSMALDAFTKALHDELLSPKTSP